MNRFQGNEPRKLAGASLSERKKSKIWVWRLKGGERGTIVIYSPKFHGVTVHWNPSAGRSSAHFTDAEHCDGCQDELPTKELYYLFGSHSEKARKVFLEMPRGAAEALQGMLAHAESFRGLRIWVERTKADNGRLRFRILEQEAGVKLPADQHPQETLFAMWGIPLDDTPPPPTSLPPSNGFLHPNGAK